MGRSGRSSVLWNYFKVESEKNKTAICLLCKLKLSFRSTVSNLKKHLRLKHRGVLPANPGQYPSIYVKTFDDSDPLSVREPESPKSNEDNVPARRSSFRG